MPKFTSLDLHSWRQFESISLDLNKKATILTGPNGCGKTTILNILGKHFGWNFQFMAAPVWGRKRTKKIFSDLRDFMQSDTFYDFESSEESSEVGSINYTDGKSCSIIRPVSNNPNYNLKYSQIRQVDGMIVPSHLPPPTQARLKTIPVDPIKMASVHQSYQSMLQQLYGASESINHPGKVFKESLVSLALFSYDTPGLKSDPELKEIFEGFQNILRMTLPSSIGFERIEVSMPDIVMVTRSGRFPIDAMSGGVNAIVMLSWQIFIAGHNKDEFTVIIDEPENHLHPSMQRSLLPSLMSAFPEYHFIIATHSPFIVTSDPTANVYALTPKEHSEIQSKGIYSRLMVESDLTGSPDVILREVLEVPSLLPTWLESKIQDAFKKHEHIESEVERARVVFEELKSFDLQGEGS